MRSRFRQLLSFGAIVSGLFLCTGAHAADRWKGSYWLPEGVSSYSSDIDSLFYFILILTGVVFLATEGALLVFLVKYRKKEGEKSYYTHGNHKLEMIWTITPAIILIVIALIQARTWNDIKDPSRFADHNKPIDQYVHVQLFAEQFDWHFRYPSVVDKTDENGKVVMRDGKPEKAYKFGLPGAITISKRLVVPKDKPVIVEMTSKDVIHSFFVPYMRLKQDVVPGMIIRCWFDAKKTTLEMREDRPKMMLRNPHGELVDSTWDYPIVCAELCGIQHYQMAGTVEVLEQKDYDEWLAKTAKDYAVDANGDPVKFAELAIFKNYWKVDPVTGLRLYGEDYDNPRTILKFPKHEEGGEHGEKK